MQETSGYSRHVRGAIIYVAPIVCLVMLGVVLNATNPLESGPLIILAVFTLLYMFIFSLLAAVLYMVGAIWRMLRPGAPPKIRRLYYVLSIVSLAPVLLVALNTLNQLELLEIVLIVIFVALGCFYVLRRSVK